MQNYPIVITSIYPHAPAIKKYIDKGHTIILVGDTKTPDVTSTKKLIYSSISDQKKRYKKFAQSLPTRHYARKNIGYLIGMSLSDAIIETDDDNFPHTFFPNFKTKKVKTIMLSASSGYINTYKQLAKNTKETIWPRGFPLSCIQNNSQKITRKKVRDVYPLQQALIDEDSDFDAIYRLTQNSPVQFKKNMSFTLKKHSYAPINTQNTFWKKEAFLFMYLPCFVSSRVCDIYRGYIAQRLLWEMGKTALFLSPSVYQKRNPHNLIQDFKEELPLYTDIQKFVEVLETVPLTGSIENKFLQIYRALIKENLLDKKELTLLNQWIPLVRKSVL